MAEFAYSAINAQGMELTGTMSAPDVGSAREQLQARGLLPNKLSERAAAGEQGVSTAFKKLKPKSLQVFSRQLATMIEAGVSVVQALVVLEDQVDDKYLKQVVTEVRSDVESGLILSKALARHPKVFNRLFVSMVAAGESSGTLDTVLDRVAIQIESETKIKRRVKGAMVYPMVVLTFRVTRAHVHAPLHRAGLPERLLVARRPAADADQDRDRRVQHAAGVLVRDLPADRSHDLHAAPAQEHGEWAAAVGRLRLEDPHEDRRRRAEDRARALLADALDPGRGRRRHHHRARDHCRDGGQLGDREVAHPHPGARARRRADEPAAPGRSRSSRRWSARW